MTRPLSPNRRQFLAALGVGTAALLPNLATPGFVRAAGINPSADQILVLVELAGGNDGLNTVVPITDSKYRHLRPEIGIGRDQTLTLDPDTGLHPAMRDMANLWEAGQMRIVEGVGYPNPDRSHFRSIEIWNTGGGSDTQTNQGWISNAFAAGGPQLEDADGVVLGGEMGPLTGHGRFSALREVDTYLDQLDMLETGRHAVRPVADRSPLEHVLSTYESAQATGDRIRTKLELSRDRRWDFPDSGLGEQLRNAARLLDAGVDVPVLKVVQDGYDTHEGQPDVHAYLLMELSEALGAFARSMQDIGHWDRVTVVTYSEFGRRAYENGSAGTDHGTAAPVFVIGGRVEGGLAGERPSLDRLVDRDLVHTTDYRSVYHSLLTELWGIDQSPFAAFNGSGLRLLKGA